MRRRRARVGVVPLVALALLASACGDAPAPAPSSSPPTAAAPADAPTYVGAAACEACHAEETKAWRGSHHDLAMQVADAASVLGDFDDARLVSDGTPSRFAKREGKFLVSTMGPGGKAGEFEVAYTFGAWPLQQYLVAFPGGRYQALNLAWDSRTAEDGGQRWFDLQAGERVHPGDAGHWTGRAGNWALQCAECHSTNLRKGYDPVQDRYRTTFSDIDVACEACHGPGSRHLEWARRGRPGEKRSGDNGLLVDLESRWNSAWHFPAPGVAIAIRDRRAPDALMNTCAPCHARRSTLREGGTPGAPLESTHVLAPVVPPQFHVDGQQRGEDYVWASFAQTRMAAAGVTCLDCHDAHTLKLRDEGNALCVRCHAPEQFDHPGHHHHATGSPGAQCVECHMPAQTYMTIDARRDHAIRVPRPDLSDALGTPNACTRCHADRKPAWAATALDRWTGERRWREREEFGTTLHAAQTGGALGTPRLLELAANAHAPAVLRASATTLAAPSMRADLLPDALALLADPEPGVRIAALGLLEATPPEVRARAASLLSDPILGVRTEAARVLADVPDAMLEGSARQALVAAVAEYVEAQQLNADWPDANANLGNLYARQQRYVEAQSAFERAIALDPQFEGGYANLADLHRERGEDADAARVLAAGLARLPDSAALHHAAGLASVRAGDRAAAVEHLAAAVRLAPANARYAYVHALALDDGAKHAKSIAALEQADRRHPHDVDILMALISQYRDRGDNAAALRAARKLAVALPDDAEVRALVGTLEQPP